MHRIRDLLPILMTLCALACSSVYVTSDYDVTMDFGSLETYDWAPPPEGASKDPRVNNRLFDGRVRRAIDYELSQRGYRMVANGSPDFWVTYHVALDRKLDVTTVQNYPVHYGSYRTWGGYSETHVREYEEGTLLIDVVAPESKSLIWRGTALTEVREQSSPEERTARIDEIVGAVLAKFPPPSGQEE